MLKDLSHYLTRSYTKGSPEEVEYLVQQEMKKINEANKNHSEEEVKKINKDMGVNNMEEWVDKIVESKIDYPKIYSL